MGLETKNTEDPSHLPHPAPTPALALYHTEAQHLLCPVTPDFSAGRELHYCAAMWLRRLPGFYHIFQSLTDGGLPLVGLRGFLAPCLYVVSPVYSASLP